MRWIVYKYINGIKHYISINVNETELTTDINKAYHFNYFDYASLYLKYGYAVEKIYL